jgi:predicted membrane GTPase involved in stress response
VCGSHRFCARADGGGARSLNHTFKAYEPFKGAIDTGRNGSLISMSQGEASAYSLVPLQARGVLFITPSTQGALPSSYLSLPGYAFAYLTWISRTTVYSGMVIGESSKALDMYVNPCLKKQLTNVRSAGADEKLVLASPKIMTMEVRLASPALSHSSRGHC